MPFILTLKKAFDRVAHQELLFKLWSFGITPYRRYMEVAKSLPDRYPVGNSVCQYITITLVTYQSSPEFPRGVSGVHCCFWSLSMTYQMCYCHPSFSCLLTTQNVWKQSQKFLIVISYKQTWIDCTSGVKTGISILMRRSVYSHAFFN